MLFELGQTYKVENKDVMQMLVILIMKILYGKQISKDMKRVINVYLKSGCKQNVTNRF